MEETNFLRCQCYITAVSRKSENFFSDTGCKRFYQGKPEKITHEKKNITLTVSPAHLSEQQKQQSDMAKKTNAM